LGGPRTESLGAVIRSFKAAVTKRVNSVRGVRLSIWQRNYYEHVIRNEESLDRIREYILANPGRWELDRENPQRRGVDDFDLWLESHGVLPVSEP